MQAVERLKEAMMDENDEFGLGGDAEANDGEAQNSDIEDFGETPQEHSATPEADLPPKETQKKETAAEVEVPEEEGEEDTPQRSRRKKKGKKKSRAPSPELAPPPSRTERRTKDRHRSATPELAEATVTAMPVEKTANEAENAEVPSPSVDPNDGEADVAGVSSQPELSKRDKRRAREAAKRAKEQEAASAPQVCIQWL